MSNIQPFTLDANKRVFIGCFNHTQQRAVNLYIDDNAELDLLLDAIAKDGIELTIECIEIDNVDFDAIRYFSVDFDAIRYFSQLSAHLEDMLNLIDQYNAAVVSDFIGTFGLNQLDCFDDAYTGIHKSDFKDFAMEMASEWMDSENVPEAIQRYFDYAAFEHDLRYDFTVGVFVWRNV